MFERDYIMRMLTSFTAVVARLMGLKKEMKHEQVFVVVNETLEKYFRLNSKMIQALTDRDLLNMLSNNEELDNEKAITIAYLLKAEGESYEVIGSMNESYKRYLTALTLYLAAVQNDAYTDIINFHFEIDDLVVRLNKYELPASYKLQLFDYFNKTEQFDAAENKLFELIESDQNHEISQKGIKFYKKLLQMDDAELIAGGLPRKEVIEGLEQFKQKASIIG
jgi:succinate dehydrogenase flavin-adding protein (antitoxin of CptAB toxin-antitoxin module)